MPQPPRDEEAEEEERTNCSSDGGAEGKWVEEKTTAVNADAGSAAPYRTRSTTSLLEQELENEEVASSEKQKQGSMLPSQYCRSRLLVLLFAFASPLVVVRSLQILHCRRIPGVSGTRCCAWMLLAVLLLVCLTSSALLHVQGSCWPKTPCNHALLQGTA